MSELKYIINEKNSECILYLKESDTFEDDNIKLVINTKDKSVNKIHEFIHKLMVKKIINNDYNNFSIDNNDISHLLTDNEFNKLIIFLETQIGKVNEKLTSILNVDKSDVNK